MNNQKVLLCGSHDALFRAMQLSSNTAIEIEQYTEQHLELQLKALQGVGMVVVLHAPPLTDGLPVVRNWRRESPDTPVVVATSDYSGATTRLLFKSGAVDVLELPADQERILACYEAYIPHFKAKHIPNRKQAHLPGARALMAAVTPGMLFAGAGAATQAMPPMMAPAQYHMEQGIDDTSGGFDISFFGNLHIQFRGRKIELTNQAKLLFACLAYHYPKALSRDYLAKIFWPEKYENAPESARRSLNVELAHIRSAFQEQAGVGRDFIRFEQNAYRLQNDWQVQSDVLIFKNLYKKIQESQRLGTSIPEDILQEAIKIYSANFLDDYAPDTYNWIDVERQHLSSVFEQIADLRSEQLCQKGNFWEATAVCSDILSRDFRMEAIHRRAMQCYASLGMLHKVEMQYNLCCRMMEQEFQSRPSPETVRLYEEIRKG